MPSVKTQEDSIRDLVRARQGAQPQPQARQNESPPMEVEFEKDLGRDMGSKGAYGFADAEPDPKVAAEGKQKAARMQRALDYRKRAGFRDS